MATSGCEPKSYNPEAYAPGSPLRSPCVSPPHPRQHSLLDCCFLGRTGVRARLVPCLPVGATQDSPPPSVKKSDTLARTATAPGGPSWAPALCADFIPCFTSGRCNRNPYRPHCTEEETETQKTARRQGAQATAQGRGPPGYGAHTGPQSKQGDTGRDPVIRAPCWLWDPGPASCYLEVDSVPPPPRARGKGHRQAGLGEKAPLSPPGNPSENRSNSPFKGITTVSVATYSASTQEPRQGHHRHYPK